MNKVFLNRAICLLIWVAIGCLCPPAANSQAGGDRSYAFLNLTWSGKAAALGGEAISLVGSDASLVNHNPALAAGWSSGTVSLGYTSYLADIGYGHATAIFSAGGKSEISGGVKWLSYGSFIEADESGNITGSFRAAEYALLIAFSHTIDSMLTFAVSVKPVLSHLESYYSAGIAFDAGALWQSDNRLLSASILFRNFGLQAITYNGGEREPLPFDIQAGFTGKLAHAPLRFTATVRHLNRLKVTHIYDTTATAPYVGSAGGRGEGLAENVFRRVTAGVEFIPGDNLWLAAGYNHQRARELGIDNSGVPAGLTWGFGVRVAGFSAGYSRAAWHPAGATNHFSLSFNAMGKGMPGRGEQRSSGNAELYH